MDPMNAMCWTFGRQRQTRQHLFLFIFTEGDSQEATDVFQWESVIGVPTEQFYHFYAEDPSFASFYGLATYREVEGEKGRQIRADVDMRGLITREDPPVFLFSSHEDGEPESLDHLVHHPNHAIAIKERCDEMGVEAELHLSEARLGEVNRAMLTFFF